MTLRNLRAYTQNKDDTLSTVTPSDYETGNGANARLRKINLNVDIATQAELNEAFNLLSNAITATGTAWKDADIQLSNDLKDWAKGSELSGALHNEITAETNRATTAEEAISNSLTAYAVTVEKDATAAEGYAASYTIKQGNTPLTTKINIPKDYVVKDAALCTVTVADQPYDGAVVGDKYIDFTVNTAETDDPKHIYLPVKDLVDVYTGATTEDAVVSVGTDNTISVSLTDKIARVGTAQDLSTVNTVYGAKAYADAKVQAASHTHENKAVLDTISSDDLASWDDAAAVAGVVKSTSATWDAAATALQSIGAGTAHDYVTVTIPAKAEGATTQTVEVAVTTADLTANTAGLAVNTNVKQYVDSKTAAQDITIATGTANGTISVTKGTAAAQDVAVKGLDTAAYEKKEAFDKAGDAAALQTAIKAAVDDTRFNSAATDDYADIDAIIADLLKVRKALGALKALNVTLTSKWEQTGTGGDN